MSPISEKPASSSRAWSLVAKVAAGVVAGVLVLLLVLGIAGVAVMKKLLDPFQPRVTMSESTVVRSIQELKRLETVIYKLDQVVTEERTTVLPPALVGDRILLIVHGDVTAGIDLAKLRPEDVRITGRNISVKLPPAEIFATRTDTNRTRVYSRDTGIFTSPDPQMETQVRRRAEGQLTAAALREGILPMAHQNARATITLVLHSLAFERVEIE
ncbi:MAG: DUF4230 domain-containing protein [Terriglobales bacterium]